MKPNQTLTARAEDSQEKILRVAIVDVVRTMRDNLLKPVPNTMYDRLCIRMTSVQRTDFNTQLNYLVREKILLLVGKKGDRFYDATYSARRKVRR